MCLLKATPGALQPLHGGHNAISQHRRYRDRLLAQIARRSATPYPTAITTAQLEREKGRYLSSFGVQAAIMFDVWRARFGREEAERRLEWAEQMPRTPLDHENFVAPPLSFFNKPRSTSGLRKICRLGMIETMWHVIARDLVVAQHHPGPHIGDWKGRGRDQQLGLILSALKSSRQAVVCADIVSAFASVNLDAVYQLPYLPEHLIRRAIDYRSHSFVRRERSEYERFIAQYTRENADEVERPPSGLLEGSPASNAIFSVLMDDLPDHMGEGIQTFIYCDNIILIAPSITRALRAKDALARYLTGHRAGPFDIRSTVAPARAHFDHLGYSVQKRGRSCPEVGLSLAASSKLGARLEDESTELDETLKWLFTSYRQCTPDLMAGYVQWVLDEACARSWKPLPISKSN